MYNSIQVDATAFNLHKFSKIKTFQFLHNFFFNNEQFSYT